MSMTHHSSTAVGGLRTVVGITADLMHFNGKLTTLDRQKPDASVVVIRDGRCVAVGSDHEVTLFAGLVAARPWCR